MRRVLQATINGEAFVSVELVMNHLVAVADQTITGDKVNHSFTATNMSEYAPRCRHDVLDKLLHQRRANARLLRQREDFRKQFKRAQDQGVTDEFEGGRYVTEQMRTCGEV